MGELALVEKDDDPNTFAVLLVRSLCDADGNLIFDPATDEKELGKLPASIAQKAFKVAQKLNGMSVDVVKELEKNSEAPRD